MFSIRGKAAVTALAYLVAALLCGPATQRASGHALGLPYDVWPMRSCKGPSKVARTATERDAQILCLYGGGMSYYNSDQGCTDYP